MSPNTTHNGLSFLLISMVPVIRNGPRKCKSKGPPLRLGAFSIPYEVSLQRRYSLAAFAA